MIYCLKEDKDLFINEKVDLTAVLLQVGWLIAATIEIVCGVYVGILSGLLQDYDPASFMSCLWKKN